MVLMPERGPRLSFTTPAEGRGRDADPSDKKKVNAHEGNKDGRQDDDMESEEPPQRSAGYVLTSLKARHGEGADVGERRREVRYDRRGPIGKLAPGQQIAGKTKRKRYEQHGSSRDPCQLPGLFVAVHEEHRQHVARDRGNNKVAPHDVHQPEQPAEGNAHHDVLNGPEGMLRQGDVVDDQKKACKYLNNEPGKRNEPEGMEQIKVLRNQVSGEVGPHEFIESDPDLKPVFYSFPHGAIR